MSIILSSLIRDNNFFEGVNGESVFIIGGADIFINQQDGERVYPITYMYDYCIKHGAIHCEKGMLHYENESQLERGDYCGSFLGLENFYDKGCFDRVIVLSGLEREDNPLLAIKQLYRLLKNHGKMNLILRSHKDIYVKYFLSEYEYKWRFSLEDIISIFRRDKLLKKLKTTNDDFVAVEIEKCQDINYIPIDIPLFSCRIDGYIKPQKLQSLGYFSQYRELDDIGSSEKTDKNKYDHNYLEKYEFFLRTRKNKAFNLLELGIFRGGSARMWERYFSQALIYCVDINPKCMQYGSQRIKPLIMDLGEVENVERLREIKPEIIIDDASHFWNHQILALFTLYDALPSGGIYILEDLETSVNQNIYSGFDNGCPIDTYTILDRINKVVVSKVPEENKDVFSQDISRVGLRTEMISFLKGSCIMIRL